MIPKQLLSREFRFIKVAKTKRAIEKGFQRTNNYFYDELELQEYIKTNQIYGILGGYGNLIIIDFDDERVQDDIISKLPETFTQKSAGKGLYHLFYYVDKPKGFRIKDLDGKTLADIQGEGTFVVGPNSVIGDRKYEIVKDVEIAKTTLQEIKNAFVKWINLDNTSKSSQIRKGDPDATNIMNLIKIPEMLHEYGIPINKNPTECPFHPSNAGKCFSYTQELWHCFHCDRGGTVFHLVIQKEDCNFQEAKEMLARRAGIELARKLDLFMINKEDIAEQFYRSQPFFYDKIGFFWFWNFERQCYEMKDEYQVMATLKEVANNNRFQVTSSIFWNETLRALKLIGRQKTPKPFFKDWIQFGSKIYDYKAKKQFEATSDYFNANPIPFKIGKSLDTPEIDKMFAEWVGEEYVLTLKETLALSALQDYPLHRIICLFGKGLNGKGVFLRFVARFFGKENVCSSNISKLVKSNFEVSRLYKKLVCIIGETDFSILKDTSILKQATGQDLISAEYKGKDGFDFENFATLFISSNSLPISEDRTDGFYRRWLIIDFMNTFEEGKDPLLRIPESEYDNLCGQLLEIIPAILSRGRFDKDGTIEERKNRYDEKSNPLNLYIKEFYERDINNDIPFYEFYEDFNVFCKERGFRELTKNNVSRLLDSMGFSTIKKDVKIGDSWKKWVYVMGLKKVSYRSYRSKSPSILFFSMRETNQNQSSNGTNGTKTDQIKEETISNIDIPEYNSWKTAEKCYMKCFVEGCPNRECAFDSTGVPYCEEHWEGMKR